jgi:glycosyltransferase involved in cell wall biosynthesis
MKVLVVNNMAPFIWGGAEELAVNLQKNLIAAGHQSEVLRIPFQWNPAARILSQMLMVRAFELWNVDRVIALKFPAYMIRHPHKILWVLHQYRQAYDLFDAGQTNLPADQTGHDLSRMIRKADEECFRESQKIFTNSEVTCKRLHQYNGFSARVLPPPLNDPELFPGAPSKGYIFAGGRVNGMKRQYLLLEALAKTPPSTRLIVAGPPDTPEDGHRLVDLAQRLGLGNRVQLDLRFLPRYVYADYVNGATAVAYLPFDEDSLGYVAMEAATAGKALITTRDSGGVLGLVRHRQTGLVTDPSPSSLAEALMEVSANKSLTRKWGMAARELWESMGISWPQTISTLLA